MVGISAKYRQNINKKGHKKTPHSYPVKGAMRRFLCRVYSRLKEHVGSIDFKVKGCVLIIVLMEHAQRDLLPLALISLWASLNPCFDRTCSKNSPRVCQ